jgi:hypothetical protein
MVRILVQRLVPVPGEFEPLPRSQWTKEERKAGKCERESDKPAMWNWARYVYQIACFVPEKDDISMKEAMHRIGGLVQLLNPDAEGTFDYPDGTEIVMEDSEYEELNRLLGKMPREAIPPHPIWARFLNDFENAKEVKRSALRKSLKPSANGHEASEPVAEQDEADSEPAPPRVMTKRARNSPH